MRTRTPSGQDAPPERHHDLLEAALEAEQQTGTHEPTPAAAGPHLLVRLGRIFGGCVVLLAGVALLVFPGPGLALIICGLSILAVDIPFARRLRDALMERADRATGFVPKHLKKWILIAGAAIGIGLSCFIVLR